MEGQAAGEGPRKESGREPAERGKENPRVQNQKSLTTGESFNQAVMTNSNNNHGC